MNRFRALLAPAAVAGVFAAAVLLAVRQTGERERALKSLAAAKGWSYSRADPGGLEARLEELFPGQSFRLANVMGAPARTFLFECGFSTKEYKDVSFASGGLRETDAPGAAGTLVELFPRVALAEKLEADKVELGDAAFSRLYVTTSKDPARARRLVNARVRALLLSRARTSAWTPQRINIAGGRIAVLAGPNHGPEAFPELLELLDGLENSLK